MKHNLSESLMTSLLSSFRGIALAVLLTTACSVSLSARADDATDIRDHNNRGNMLLARRLFQDAISEYETVLQIDPSHAVAKANLALAHNEWGIWYFRARKYREAKEQWEIALKINPNDANAKRNLMLPSLRLAAPPPNAPDAPPKPTGPQDWNPFDESLDKPQVKKPISNAAASAPPGETVTVSSSGSGTAAGAGAGSSTPAPSPSGASLVQTSTTQVGGITSGASIVGSGGTVYSAQATAGETSTAGGIKNANGFENSGTSGPVILPSSGPTTSGNLNGTASVPSKASDGDPFSPGTSGPVLTPDVAIPDAPTSSVRIIGGSSDSASIIIGGAPSSNSSGTTPYVSTVSGGGGTANVFKTPGTPTVPANTVPGGGAPIRFSPRPAAGTVPMSWPGSGESASQAPPAQAGSSGSSKLPPSFLSKPEDNDSQKADEKVEDNAATVDDVLAKIENKVYGKVSKGMPILKRIERLEVETMGKKKSGSIADRLKELKETYGF